MIKFDELTDDNIEALRCSYEVDIHNFWTQQGAADREAEHGVQNHAFWVELYDHLRTCRDACRDELGRRGWAY